MNCQNCNTVVRQGLASWHYECPVCKLEMSTLAPAENLADEDADVDEAVRAAGLVDLRKANFLTTLEAIKKLVPAGGKLLDVGCAHGWFLDAAVAARFQATGIEPSERVARSAKERGHAVRDGLFPSALAADETFDVISFNDVFEHIPSAASTMHNVAAALNNDGVLVLSIPTRKGFFYKLSRLCMRLGVAAPFERLWQKHFSSPHLYYFDSTVLESMGQREGLALVHRSSLPTIHLRGLWQRLNYDKSSSRTINAVLYAVITIAYPVLLLLPSDIDLLIFRKQHPAATP